MQSYVVIEENNIFPIDERMAHFNQTYMDTLQLLDVQMRICCPSEFYDL